MQSTTYCRLATAYISATAHFGRASVTSAVFGSPSPIRYGRRNAVGRQGAHAHRVDKEVTHSEPGGGTRTLWDKRMRSTMFMNPGVWV
jgi:hypothetical protein